MDRSLAPAVHAGPFPLDRSALGLVLAAATLVACLAVGGCGSSGTGPPIMASGPVTSSAALTPSSTGASTSTSSTPLSAEARIVAAAVVVQRFCRLIDEHRYGAALRLLAAPSVWPLRDLRAVRRLRFESAQAWGEPADRQVTLLVTFRAVVTWRSPLTDGLNDVFFTLTRRVTTGEWLIAAVSTSP